jgi:purine-binding chemotaxis protein CheW
MIMQNDPGANDPEAALKQLLLARAQYLSVIPQDKEETFESLSILEFQAGEERYGIETIYAAEVAELKRVTRVPGTPEFIIGALNHRGTVVAVLDLAKMLGIPIQGQRESGKLIFLKRCDSQSCLLVDDVYSVIAVAKKDILPFVMNRMGTESSFYAGVLENGVSILEPKRLLADQRFLVDIRLL